MFITEDERYEFETKDLNTDFGFLGRCVEANRGNVIMIMVIGGYFIKHNASHCIRFCYIYFYFRVKEKHFPIIGKIKI